MGDGVLSLGVDAEGVEDLLAAFLGILGAEGAVVRGFGHLEGGGAHLAAFPDVEDFGGVVLPVGDTAEIGDKFGEVIGIADFLELASFFEFGGEDDEVDGLGGFAQVGDEAEYDLVRGEDELIRAQGLKDGVGGGAVLHGGSDDGAFGSGGFG
jgi:hypothetical protein